MTWKLVKTQNKWLAEERGTITKDWGGKLALALAYPNRYAVGMANLGFQTVYFALNQFPRVVCERVFFPEPEDFNLLMKGSAKSIISVETQRSLREFDIIAFALNFESDFPNILRMLDLSGINLLPPERSGHDPFLMAGGVATFLNPEPLAPFFDFFLLGEVDDLLQRFVSTFQKARDKRLDREQTLTLLAENVPSLYVPSFYEVSYSSEGHVTEFRSKGSYPEKVRCHHREKLEFPTCKTHIFTSHCEFSNVNLIEIGRGCGRGCRFCAAGYIYRPPRYATFNDIVDGVKSSLDVTSRVGLLSPAVIDHPEIENISRTLKNMNCQTSVSSLRADSLTGSLLENLTESGHFSVAIAPDAGSERLRRVINKNLSEDDILNAAEKLAFAGLKNIKLYFMVGLPTETREDVEAIVKLVKQLKHRVLSSSHGKKYLATLTLSINSFVPKPFTPFQWVGFTPVKELKERIKIVRNGLKGVPNVRIHCDLPKWAYRQAILSRGDRRVSLLLQAINENQGNWQKALENVNLNPDFYASRERQKEEIFPWDFIDHGIKKEYLWDEYQRALSEEVSPPCDPGICHRCGVCK